MTLLPRADPALEWLPRRLPALETRRLLLRTPRPRDANAIAAGLADYEVARMLTQVPRPYLRQDARDWLGAYSDGVGARNWAFAVTLDETAVGAVSFDWRERGLEIGYWLDRRYWRRGLMSEAVSAALIWYFASVPDGVVHSGVLSDNTASMKLQQKLGFAITGLDEVFSLSRNCSLRQIETRLVSTAFNPVPGAAPAAYRHVV